MKCPTHPNATMNLGKCSQCQSGLQPKVDESGTTPAETSPPPKVRFLHPWQLAVQVEQLRGSLTKSRESEESLRGQVTRLAEQLRRRCAIDHACPEVPKDKCLACRIEQDYAQGLYVAPAEG